MAKVAFSKLALSKTSTTGIVEINGQSIEVKKYLPIDEKLALIGEVISNSHDENNFPNPLKIEVFFTIAVIKYYTNISLTEMSVIRRNKLSAEQKKDIIAFLNTLTDSKYLQNTNYKTPF